MKISILMDGAVAFFMGAAAVAGAVARSLRSTNCLIAAISLSVKSALPPAISSRISLLYSSIFFY